MTIDEADDRIINQKKVFTLSFPSVNISLTINNPDVSWINQSAKGTKMTYCFRNVWKSELSKDSVTK